MRRPTASLAARCASLFHAAMSAIFTHQTSRGREASCSSTTPAARSFAISYGAFPRMMRVCRPQSPSSGSTSPELTASPCGLPNQSGPRTTPSASCSPQSSAWRQSSSSRAMQAPAFCCSSIRSGRCAPHRTLATAPSDRSSTCHLASPRAPSLVPTPVVGIFLPSSPV